MIQENDIRAKLLELASLDEFEDWLVRNSWNMHLDSNPSAQKLVGKIELALAAFHDGYLTESALRQSLKNLASLYEVRFGSDGGLEPISYTSNSTVQISPVAMPDAAVFAS